MGEVTLSSRWARGGPGGHQDRAPPVDDSAVTRGICGDLALFQAHPSESWIGPYPLSGSTNKIEDTQEHIERSVVALDMLAEAATAKARRVHGRS